MAPAIYGGGHTSGPFTAVSALLLLACGLQTGEAGTKGKQDGDEDQVTVTYLWPILMNSLPLSGPKGIEDAEFGRQLAKLGMRQYKEYVNSTLPMELELDQAFAAEFDTLDHSRVNMAFHRWQKRVYADHFQVPTEQLISQRESMLRLPGIGYTWPELYSNPQFLTLQTHIDKLSRNYLKRVGYAKEELPKQFRIFTWVEVFGKGDAMRPAPRTDGAFLAGKYYANGDHGSVKFAFEDPRGINPPFGKTFNHEVYPGNAIFFPVWASYFITPNMKKQPVVCYSFLIYPAEGNDRHWRDDKTAGYVSAGKA